MTTLKELLTQIDALDIKLTSLGEKAKALREVLGSSLLGDVGFQKAAKDLERIEATMGKLASKRVRLFNESEVFNLKAIDKSIATIEQRMSELQSRRSTMVGAGLGGTPDFQEVERSLARIERAYTSMLSRRRNVVAGGKVDFAEVDLEARVAPRERVTSDQYRAAVAFEEAQRRNAEGMNKAWSDVMTYIRGGAVKGPAGATLPIKLGPVEEIQKLLGGAGMGLGQEGAKFADATKSAIVSLQKTGASLKNLRVLEQVSEGVSKIDIRYTAPDAKGRNISHNYKAFVDDMGNWAKTLEQLHAKQYAASPTGQKLTKVAEGFGFRPESLQSVTSEGQGGYSIAKYQQTMPSGAKQIQNFRVTDTGEVSLAPVKRQFQSFGQSVGRDIVELTKWSLAISAIYGPINALSAAMTQLIENETKLADVAVALNSEVANTDQIFNDAYSAATKAGEGVGGVIDAFGQAYRAAGRISNANDRYTASLKLLDASLVLSKISTLDQAQAIDTLTAGLYQSGTANEDTVTKFDRATEVLDKWVRVSKIANVDIATLATGMAVLGDSAEAAGLSMEELNALIGSIAETSIAGGKEAANIAKALVGNYIQPEAEKALSRYGIAIKDINGKNREFLEIMGEISSQRRAGLIGETDLQQISMALGGGGIRRAADVSRFIENFPRMGQLVAEQANSSGEAADALAIKLDTVQTSATNLSNAFVALAQSLGTEGGLLDVFSGTLKFATLLVEALDKVASATGKVAPLLMGLGAAALVLKFSGSDWRTTVGNNITPMIAGMFGGGKGQFMTAAQESAYYKRSANITDTLSGRNAAGQGIGIAAAIGIPAIQNAISGDTTEAIGNVIGGAIGSALGPVGALVGASIAESFVRKTLTYETQFADFFAGAITPKRGGTGVEGQASTDEFMKQAFRSIGGGSENLGKYITKKLYDFSTSWIGKSLTQTIAPSTKGIQFKTEEALAYQLLQQANPELAAQMKARFAATTGQAIGGGDTAVSLRQVAESQKYGETLQQYQKERQDTLRNKLITGEIKPSEYARQIQALSGYTVAATKYMAALKDEAGKLGDAFTDDTTAYMDFLDITSSGNQELIDQINSQVAAVEYLENLWSNWAPGTKEMQFENKLTGETITGTKADVASMLADARTALASTIKFGAEQARLQNLNITPVQGSYITPTPQKDLNLVLRETMKVQDKRYADLQQDQYDALKNSFEEFQVLVEDSGKTFYDKVTGIDKSIFQEMWQKLEKEGRISGTGDNNLGFQQMDVTRPQLETAVTQANNLALNLQKQFGYQPQFEDVLIATNDEQISKQHVDMKMLQYILQQILDTEKKQLEGMYNIPEGATFWVPLTAAWLADRSGGAGAGGLEELLKSPELIGGGKPTQDVTQKAQDRIVDRKQKLLNEYETQFYGPSTLDRGKDYRPSGLGMAPRPIGLDKISQVGQKEALPESGIDRIVQAVSGISPVLDMLMKLLQSRNDIIPQKGPSSGGGLGSAARGENTTTSMTKFDIKFSSTTQLVVDGRTLASIIKPYLAADLLKANEAGGTITRTYVI